MRLPALVALANFCAFALAPQTAAAIEHEHHIGFDVGGSALSVDGESSPQIGIGMGAHYTYGLNDQFNFIADGDISFLTRDESGPKIPANRPANVTRVGAGAAYVVDVLEWVPYFGVVISGYRFAGGTIPTQHFDAGVAVELGLDYRFSRSFSAGIVGRQSFVLTDFNTYPSYTNVFARVEYVWGW